MVELTKTQVKELGKMKAGYTYSEKQKQAYVVRLKANGKEELTEFEITKLMYFYKNEPTFIYMESPRYGWGRNSQELRDAVFSQLLTHNMEYFKYFQKASGIEAELREFLNNCNIEDSFKKWEKFFHDHGRTHASMNQMIFEATKKYRLKAITFKAVLLSFYLPYD